METVSENNRGRPRKYGRGKFYLAELEKYAGDPCRGINSEKWRWTERQQQNVVLAERAKDRIESRDESWLDPDLVSGRHWPQSVLTQLGRLEDVDHFWLAATWYYEHGHHLRAHDAAKAIRRYFA